MQEGVLGEEGVVRLDFARFTVETHHREGHCHEYDRDKLNETSVNSEEDEDSVSI